ncbi:unnamed protein product [Symbiodinium natans]|uniref:Uncharacterized protein n=1 Tax=Symbiodinium natans TaxID=878477 RepID=A0A812JX35_9DINO|nr:unnamed protein product [Symbiodinium natans]
MAAMPGRALLAKLTALVLGPASADVLPAALHCTSSALAVPSPTPGTEEFTCPPYFHARTCCQLNEMLKIWEKVEDMLQFIVRVLDDQGRDLQAAEEEEAAGLWDDGSACAKYHVQLFSSRLQGSRAAREATAKGLDILQGSTMHLLCAACFQSSSTLKLEQVDNFTKSALLSLQDRMGAIFTEQLLQDVPPDPSCSLAYVTELTAGSLFPAWGRFSPALRTSSTSLLQAFSAWMDRVLSLLVEVPGSLLFQHTMLKLLLFYGERPDSDAFRLLIGQAAPSESQHAPIQADPPNLCPDNTARLFLFVRQAVQASTVSKCYKELQAIQSPLLRWVVTNQSHVTALSDEAALRGQSPKVELIWRRFEVRNLDSFVADVCPGLPAWVADVEAMDCQAGTADTISRLTTAPVEEDLLSSSWPSGLRPARPQPPPVSWPPLLINKYIQAHAALVRQLATGGEPANPKVLVYVCTAMSYCGGHGDRLNGMLSAFVLALLSDRAFFIDSQRPVPLSMVLQPRPGGLDWRMFGSHAALAASFNLNDNLAAFEQNPRSVLESQEQVIRLVSNQRLTAAALHASEQRAESLGLSRQPELHSHLFRMLFAPSPALQARLNARNLPAGRRIGLHFRAGDQMPQNWKDPPRHALSQLDEFLDCAESLEKDYGWEATFILFADTDKVLTMPRVKELMSLGKLVWPSEPDGLVHLDRSPATLTVRGLLQTWADWWTLAFDVDALVLCHSGFGATALEIGHRRPAVVGRGCVPADGSTG